MNLRVKKMIYVFGIIRNRKIIISSEMTLENERR